MRKLACALKAVASYRNPKQELRPCTRHCARRKLTRSSKHLVARARTPVSAKEIFFGSFLFSKRKEGSLKIEYLGRVIFHRRRFGKKALEVLRSYGQELRPCTLHCAHEKVFKPRECSLFAPKGGGLEFCLCACTALAEKFLKLCERPLFAQGGKAGR